MSAEKAKLKRAGAVTIQKYMDIIAGGSCKRLNSIMGCGFCEEYRYVGGGFICEACPVHIAEGKPCFMTSWHRWARRRNISKADKTSFYYARILWIHDLTGADIPTEVSNET